MTTPAITPAPATADKPWRLATLAGMASYLDAGTIIGVATSLALWQTLYGMSPLEVGLLSALLTICIGIGSIVGGRIGDRLGRKKVYAVDLLIFSFGLLWLIFAFDASMLFVGVVILGLSVGADIPTSLSLVGEMAPAAKRGRLLGFTQVLWNLGPVGVIIVAFATSSLGEWMPRIVFGHLFVIAMVTWFLRRKMSESLAWKSAAAGETRPRLRDLFRGPLLKGILFTTVFYTLITVATNFFGQFGTYMLITVAGLDQTNAVGFNFLLIPVGLIAAVIFIRLVDTRFRAAMFYVGATIQAGAFVLLLVVEPDVGSILASMILFVFGVAFAGEAIYKVWSQEIFPTLLRGTAQGFSFGVARLVSAGFAVVIPTLLLTDFRVLVVILVSVLTAAGLVGAVFMPRKRGQTIAEIDKESGA